MKSKSKNDVADNGTFEYIHLYKSAAETTVKLKGHEIGSEPSRKIKKRSKNIKVPEIVATQKKSKPVDENSEITLSSNNETPVDNKADTKSIIKNLNNPSDVSKSKPKKRNKSVSFVLDDKDEVTVKKTKSETSTTDGKKIENTEINSKKNKNRKKIKKPFSKDGICEKESNSNNASSMLNEMTEEKNILTNSRRVPQSNQENIEPKNDSVKIGIKKNRELKKQHDKHKKKEKGEIKQNVEMLPENKIEPNNIQLSKKSKKKKHSPKLIEDIDAIEDEPSIKTRKQDVKPDVVAKDLENLNIGDNTHTLTNLLDEMVVVDKNKKKKKKQNKKNAKQPATSADIDLEGSKEKEKWKKKRWNKDKKGLKGNYQFLSSVIVDNLPIGIILNYKKLLQEHFAKCGPIKKIGIAEVYPSEDPKPVFTTTILFDSENTALKALEEDNTSFKGNFIRVKKVLSPKDTMLVVRSYGELTQQALSSIFNSAGRIRNIEVMTKRKKLMATAFVEFDGPLDFDRLTKIASETKIGNKPIYTSRFEYRRPTTSHQEKNSVANGIEESSDSSDD